MSKRDTLTPGQMLDAALGSTMVDAQQLAAAVAAAVKQEISPLLVEAKAASFPPVLCRADVGRLLRPMKPEIPDSTWKNWKERGLPVVNGPAQNDLVDTEALIRWLRLKTPGFPFPELLSARRHPNG